MKNFCFALSLPISMQFILHSFTYYYDVVEDAELYPKHACWVDDDMTKYEIYVALLLFPCKRYHATWICCCCCCRLQQTFGIFGAWSWYPYCLLLMPVINPLATVLVTWIFSNIPWYWWRLRDTNPAAIILLACLHLLVPSSILSSSPSYYYYYYSPLFWLDLFFLLESVTMSFLQQTWSCRDASVLWSFSFDQRTTIFSQYKENTIHVKVYLRGQCVCVCIPFLAIAASSDQSKQILKFSGKLYVTIHEDIHFYKFHCYL